MAAQFTRNIVPNAKATIKRAATAFQVFFRFCPSLIHTHAHFSAPYLCPLHLSLHPHTLHTPTYQVQHTYVKSYLCDISDLRIRVVGDVTNMSHRGYVRPTEREEQLTSTANTVAEEEQ